MHAVVFGNQEEEGNTNTLIFCTSPKPTTTWRVKPYAEGRNFWGYKRHVQSHLLLMLDIYSEFFTPNLRIHCWLSLRHECFGVRVEWNPVKAEATVAQKRGFKSLDMFQWCYFSSFHETCTTIKGEQLRPNAPAWLHWMSKRRLPQVVIILSCSTRKDNKVLSLMQHLIALY